MPHQGCRGNQARAAGAPAGGLAVGGVVGGRVVGVPGAVLVVGGRVVLVGVVEVVDGRVVVVGAGCVFVVGGRVALVVVVEVVVVDVVLPGQTKRRPLSCSAVATVASRSASCRGRSRHGGGQPRPASRRAWVSQSAAARRAHAHALK